MRGLPCGSWASKDSWGRPLGTTGDAPGNLLRRNVLVVYSHTCAGQFLLRHVASVPVAIPPLTRIVHTPGPASAILGRFLGLGK